MKWPSRKYVIIPISLDNANKFMNNSSSHITNTNKTLKNIKLDIMADFICIKNKGVIIITNKTTEALCYKTRVWTDFR